MARSTGYLREASNWALPMIFKYEGEYSLQRSAILPIARELACAAETFPRWEQQAETDWGRRTGLSTNERERE